MALTKVQKTGITDNAIDADKIEDGTIVAADIAPGTITNAKLAGSIANDKLANSSITVNGSSVSLGGSVSAGKVQWQSVVTADGSTATSATAGYGYFIDTTSAAHTLTLPGSPSAGDTIAIKDYAGTFGTNNLTIGRNGNNIQGVANDSLISTNRASIVLVYIDATKGWLYTNESNVADLENIGYTSATGGTITTSGDYKIHTFTGDGCFVVSTAGFGPAQLSKVDYLVVAGGGGGGSWGGGGGGAGGYRESKDTDIASPHTANPIAATTGITVSATTYPITVGAGGANAPSYPARENRRRGNNSVFSTITSTGGGRGGTNCGPACGPQGNAGGSGGGSDYGNPAGTGNTPPVSPPQGNSGGAGAAAPNYIGGGGGGAGAVGGNAVATPQPPGTPKFTIAGAGGDGVASSITGSPVTRAGGGGGGGNDGDGSAQDDPKAAGGAGGGGAGGHYACTAGTAGTANTGGGGGAAGATSPTGNTAGPSGAGGSGIVIIRYKYQ